MAWLEHGRVTTVVTGTFKENRGRNRTISFTGHYDCHSTHVSDTFAMTSDATAGQRVPDTRDGYVLLPPGLATHLNASQEAHLSLLAVGRQMRSRMHDLSAL